MSSRIRIQDLRVGMVLAENLTNDDGMMILPAGKVIDQQDLEKLSQIEKLSFAVVEGDAVLLDILKEETKTVDEQILKEVDEAFKYWNPDAELFDEFRLLAIKYRVLLRRVSQESN